VPNARVSKDFLNVVVRERRFRSVEGTNNSYNKPKTVEGRARIRWLAKAQLTEENLDNRSLEYLTASINDSKSTLEKKELQLMEARKLSRKVHTDSESKNESFVAKSINGIPLMSPLLS
jgi:hypothetical protein